MSVVNHAQRVLEKIVHTLDLDAEVTQGQYEGAPLLQISSEDSKYLIGKRGDRLDDLQYLVNRIVQKQMPDAERVRVDCNDYRAEHEQRLIDRAHQIAKKVIEHGKPCEMRALNAYHRRIVHNALKDLPVETASQAGNMRYKKIFVSLPK